MVSSMPSLTVRSVHHQIKNRYRELLRVTRMWRNIQNIIRFGFAHSGNDLGPGSLAMFCPTCPQPGINLPENWKEDPEQCVPIICLTAIQT
jgi:hypothetical protein